MATAMAFTIEVGLAQSSSTTNKTKTRTVQHGSGTASVKSKNTVSGKSKMNKGHKHTSAKKAGAVKDTTGVVTTSGSLSNMCIIQY